MKKLLSDEQYAQYLADGILVLQPQSLSEDFHDALFDCAQDLYAMAEGSRSKTAHLDILGDSLRGRIPSLERLFEDPVVSGALESILGEGYAIHPHNFVHKSSLTDQMFHQDGNLPWNERGHYRSHRPDWALLFYYPQEVTTQNGPTEVILGSQYWTNNFEREDGTWHSFDPLDRTISTKDIASDDLLSRDRKLDESIVSFGVPDMQRSFVTVPKGSVVICHYDIFHRGSRAREGAQDRFMYKFHFMRTTEPSAAAWNNHNGYTEKDIRECIRPVVRSIWNWSKNTEAQSELEPKNSAYMLFNGHEAEKVEAAYLLAECQIDQAIDDFLEALDADEESVRRAACYGLKASSHKQAEKILPFVQSQRVGTRRLAVYALGNAVNGQYPEVIACLLTALTEDSDDLVRSNAAYALGHVMRHSDAKVSPVVDVLIERLRVGAETNNTDTALFPRSTVRQSIAYSLLQAASNHDLSPEQIERILTIALADDDRYVQGFAVEIARRSKSLSEKSIDLLLASLSRLRTSPRPRKTALDEI